MQHLRVKTSGFSYSAAYYIFCSLFVKKQQGAEAGFSPADNHEEALAFSVQISTRTKHLLSFQEVSYRERYQLLQEGVLDSLSTENLAVSTVSFPYHGESCRGKHHTVPLPMENLAERSTSFPSNGKSC